MDKDSLKYFIFASIISADNDEFTEEVKQEIISRFSLKDDWKDHNWEYILEPIGDTEKINKLIRLLR